MIKSIYIPGKTFATKEALFAALKANEDVIIDYKKSLIYDSKNKDNYYPTLTEFKEVETTKGIGFATKDNHIYPIISTCNYFDSHKDVHFDNSMNRTCTNQQGKVYYCADHNLTASGIIASKSFVKMMIKTIPWSLVGKAYEGTTQALIFEIDKANISNQTALKLIETEKDLQNSIRMQYVQIKMGINSKNKDFAINKAYYDANIHKIINRDQVEQDGYFFGVEELKIVGEGSLVIAGGSNDATAIYQQMKSEPAQSTSVSIDPPRGTQKRSLLMTVGKINSQIKN